VYLYEYAATSSERANLANIRKGEYESLSEKLSDARWQPDYGPAGFDEQVARTGATVIGARGFLVAYNVNFNTREPRLVAPIASAIRERSRPKLNADGSPRLDSEGETVYEPGQFRGVKAMAWYIEEFGCAQITMNLTDIEQSPLHLVFDKVNELAMERGLRVTGSELVGLAPRSVLTEAGRYFLDKQKAASGQPANELIHVAIKSLGLADVKPFSAAESVLEYRLEEASARPLANLTVSGFVDELSSSSPAPGGGSTAALAGALAAALAAMVPNLTIGRPGYHKKSVRRRMNTISAEAQRLKEEYLRAIDDDTAAFNHLLEAFRMPKDTPDNTKVRSKAIKHALRAVTEIPLATLKRSARVIELLIEAARHGNLHAVSDCGTGGALALACAEGALYNVRINLLDFKSDDAFAIETHADSEGSITYARERYAELVAVVAERMEELRREKGK
jgi:glutamate formiminotransferase/formiminotetrahydrofolate cyclodeaminase